MNLTSDDFELFGVPRRHAQDPAVLDERRRTLQGQVHPDRFVAEGAAAQRVAMQWALRVNEAYRRLKDPLQRAIYLCELNGVPVDVTSQTPMLPEFLAQQMSWREALAQAQTAPELRVLADAARRQHSVVLAHLQSTLDQQADYNAAAQQIRELMFIERYTEDLDQRLDALGQ